MALALPFALALRRMLRRTSSWRMLPTKPAAQSAVPTQNVGRARGLKERKAAAVGERRYVPNKVPLTMLKAIPLRVTLR